MPSSAHAGFKLVLLRLAMEFLYNYLVVVSYEVSDRQYSVSKQTWKKLKIVLKRKFPKIAGFGTNDDQKICVSIVGVA